MAVLLELDFVILEMLRNTNIQFSFFFFLSNPFSTLAKNIKVGEFNSNL